MAKLLAASIGWPIEQSLSPVIHNYWLQQYRIDGFYEKIAIKPEDLPKRLGELRETHIGFSVTLPHKETIIPLLDHLTDTAQRIGAVNCVVRQADETLLGDNTDAYGFAENLCQQTARRDWRGARAIVLGAGGAARAVVVALMDLGFTDITVFNRNAIRAKQLINELSAVIRSHPAGEVGAQRAAGEGLRLMAYDPSPAPAGHPLPQGEREEGSWLPNAAQLLACDLLVNTTSLGMYGQPLLKIDLVGLPKTAIVADIVYKPLQTNLLKQAAVHGLQTVDGLGMLLHQAVPAFERFFGQRPEVTLDLHKHVEKELAA